MKKTINHLRSSGKIFLSGSLMLAVLSVAFLGADTAHAMLTRSLDLGSQGADVSELQTYYSADASIYPSGLVTGYFGALSASATQKFQTAQGIVSNGTPASTGYGRVGPTTMARLNSLMGNNTQVSWDSAPILSTPTLQISSNSATISWATNEVSQGQVYYDTNPLQLNEATGPRQLPYVSGAYVYDGTSLQTNHSITLTNLKSDTTYYFLTRGVDSTGNMSMTMPNSFHTNR